MDFLVTKNFKTPYVVSTGLPYNPTRVMLKQYREGEVIKGELKFKNGKPAFVITKGVLVVPLDVIRKITTTDIYSEAAGSKPTTIKPVVISTKDPKKYYIDGLVLGSLAGAGITFFCEKKGWIQNPSIKNKVIGAGIGATIAIYIVYKLTKRRENLIKQKAKK